MVLVCDSGSGVHLKGGCDELKPVDGKRVQVVPELEACLRADHH
jgi:hypothetical protein